MVAEPKLTGVKNNRTCIPDTSSDKNTLLGRSMSLNSTQTVMHSSDLSSSDQPSSFRTTNPLVSIIIPVYNVAKVLERCVNSVLTQTYTNLEIILVDDGSTDMSGKFCDVFAKRDARVKVIHQKNAGLSGARNVALDVARGDFVAFVDSDDAVHPDYISLLLDLCLRQDLKMAICAARERSDASEIFPNLAEAAELSALSPASAKNPSLAASPDVLGGLEWPAPTPDLENVEILETTACLTRMLCERGFTMSAWGKLYARELFERDSCPESRESLAQSPKKSVKVRFPLGKLHEDVGTTYKLVLQCDRIAVSPDQKYDYYQTPGSITQQSYSPRKLDLIELTDQMCDDLEAWGASRDAAEREQIKHLTQKRRMHARFSILRQMVLIDPATLPKGNPTTLPEAAKTRQNLEHPETPAADPQKPIQTRPAFLKTRREIVRYLRRHKSYILRNPLADRRDRLAMTTLLLGLPAFKFAWLSYQKQRNRKSS